MLVRELHATLVKKQTINLFIALHHNINRRASKLFEKQKTTVESHDSITEKTKYCTVIVIL